MLALFWNEEQVNKLWDDDELAFVIQGCKEVELEVISTRKHLAVTPKQVGFENWVIQISPDMSTRLLKIVDLIPFVKVEA